MQVLESDAGVYTGPWINWDKGRALGATITLGKKNGQMLTAVLALFVTAAGTSFFRIACFALHQAFSRRNPQDALYHQRQAVLRNSATGAQGTWKLLQVAWAWRKSHGQKVFSRLLPSILCATLITAAFVVAGIYTSRISVAPGDEVLLTGENCGIYYRPADEAGFLELSIPYWGSIMNAATGHAQQCYNVNSSSESQNCETYYVKNALSYIKETDVECPFAEQLCQKNASVIRFDTGLLSSHFDFGVNAPPQDRALYREVLTCAPLTREGFTKDRAIPNDSSRNNETQYFYGPPIVGKPLNTANLTWWSPREPIEVNDAFTISNLEYGLSVVRYFANYPDSEQPGTWLPIPELRRSDANTFLVAIAPHSVQFVSPVDDPVFSAHRANPFSNQTYLADYTEGVIACTTQHEMCDPGRQHCTGLTTKDAVTEALNTTFTTPIQQGTAASIFSLFTHVNLEVGEIVAAVKASALHAGKSFDGGIQGPLPADQWQKEVELWWQTALAVLQMGFTEQATGPSSTTAQQQLFRAPTTAGGRHRCRSQKVRSPAYTSFSTLGLGLVFGLGGLVVGVSWCVEPGIKRLQKQKNVFPRLEWAANGTLQLQRLAHEELGAGTWCRGAESVPLTVVGAQRLAVLDWDRDGGDGGGDGEYPVLRVLPEAWEVEDGEGEDKESHRSVVR